MARRGVGGHNEREWPPSLSRLSTLWCDARSLASLILASPLHTPHSLYSPRFLFLFFLLCSTVCSIPPLVVRRCVEAVASLGMFGCLACIFSCYPVEFRERPRSCIRKGVL